MDRPLPIALASQHVHIEVFRGQRGFLSLKQAWERLAENRGEHFLHFPAWYEAELNRRTSTSEILFVALYAGGELFSVLPFERLYWPKIKLPIVQLFYFNEMGVNDALSTRPLGPYLIGISARLRAEFSFFALIRWQCLPLKGHAASLGIPLYETHGSKYLDLSAGNDRFWEGARRKLKRNIDRNTRNAEAGGQLRLQVARTPRSLDEAYGVFLQLENSGWKARRGTSILKQPGKHAYYDVLEKGFGATGRCQINVLWRGGEAIAAQFCVRAGNTLYMLKIAYSEHHSRLGPSNLLLAQLIDYCATQTDVTRISFVTGQEWMDQWKPAVDPIGIGYSPSGTLLSKFLVASMRPIVATLDYRRKKKYAERPARALASHRRLPA